MEFISSVGANVVSDLLRTTTRGALHHMNRLYQYESYEKNVKILIEQLDILEKHREEVETKVNSAKQKGDEIRPDVTEWLNETNKTLFENRAKAKLPSQNISDFVFHSEEMIDENTLSSIGTKINDLINRYVGFNGLVSYPSDHLDENYMAFDARRPILEEVMEKLKDSNVKMIGLHGMGGIGKTTLAKEIARQAKKEANLFDKVIMGSAVSQTPDFAIIQFEIAQELGIKFDNGETKLRKARRLREELSKQVKVLIILDDIWKKINLSEDIGIYFGDDQKRCKILFTSRRQGLYSGRHVVELALTYLEDDESEKFFRKKVGETVDNDPKCESLVSDLVKACGGVPIVIDIVASGLQNAPSSTWRTYLEEMKNSASQNIENMDAKVIQSIQMSYNYLESDEAKSLLLLCSIFREDELISDDDLLMYCMGWSLLNYIDKSEKARDKVHTLIDTLRKNSLLLPSDKSESDDTYHWVKLHDVIRDALKSIALKEGYFSLRKDEKLPEENLKDLLAMSLEYDANELPNKLPCPNLVFLRRLGPFISLSDCFFEETKKLRVLKLQCVRLHSPPSSYSCLVGTLETLCLNDCDLEDTAFLGSFKNLKCLDLSSSTFKKISKEVGQLTRLQLLKLDDCEELKVIEPDVISNLINLEELYMRNVEEIWDNVSLTELKKLPRLNTLCITIANDNLLSKDLFTYKMKRYDIIVGPFLPYWDLEGKRYSRVLQLELNKADVMNECGIDKLISDCQALVLTDCNVRYLVNSALECNHLVFQNLEKMKLVGLKNLQNICDGEFAADSFCKLKVVEVSQCHSLKNIFPVSNFGELEKIKAEECDMMEEIVFHRREDGTHQKIEFLKLLKLELHHLPNLVQFCKVGCEHNIPSSSSSLETLPFFMEEVSFPTLENLYLKSLEKVQMIWPDQVREIFYMQNLKYLTIDDFPNVKYLFPFALARSLVHLTTLSIMSCKNMEEILVIKEAGEERSPNETILLSNLKSFSDSLKKLKLRDCPKLTSFHKSCTNKFEQVEEPFFNEKVSFASMEELEFSYCDSLQMIWPNQLKEVSYMQNLKYLILLNCGNLKYIFSLAMARSLVQLGKVRVQSCGNIQEVLVIKEAEEEGSLNKTILFPKLERIELDSLSNLRSFSGGKCLTMEYSSLKSLIIRQCPRLKTFHKNCTNEFEQVEEPFFNEKVSFASMEELELTKCDSVKMIWPNQLEEVSYMQNFKKINLSKCENLEYICSLAMARSLVQLKELRVESCETIQEVLATKEAEEGGRNWTISFPNLEILRLYSLSNLKSFSGGKCLAIQYPSLKSLTIEKCPRLKTFHRNCSSSEFENAEEHLFNEKVSFPNSEELYFGSLEKYTGLDPKILSIYMKDCPAVKYLFDFAFARSLEQLRKLSICLFENMEEILVIKEAGEEGSLKKITLFPKLENIILRSLSKLKSFSGGGKYLTIECPSLKSLTIEACPRLKTFYKSCTNEIEQVEEPFFNEKVSFASMQKLDLKDCNSIQMIWPNQLEEVSYMENLKKISLWNCGKLEYICSFEMARSLVQLKELDVHSCETIQEVLVMNEAEEGNLNEIILFPKLENIYFLSLSNLRSFSGGKCLTMEYPSLKSLTIWECPRLKTFHKNCTNEFEQVEEPFFNEKVSFPSMEELGLSDCHSVQMIWPNQLEEVSYMQNFKKLILENCGNLKYIFSLAMARSLVQLEEVHVQSCGNIQEVLVIKEAEEEGSLNKTILFPKLERIELHSLSNFISFSGGKCLAIEYPFLKLLTITQCPRLKTFHKNCTNEFEQVEEPFFNEKVLFARLEELELSGCNSMQMIWPNQLEEVSYMKNLKTLKLQNYRNLEYICSLVMARSMVQLTELHVESCETIQEVFVTKEAEEEGSLSSGKCFAIECPSLNSLTIIKCPSLKTFHRSCTNSEFEKAEEPLLNEKAGLFNLEDQRWKCLLMSPFVSFQNLVQIEIYGCDTLINLMYCSTAKSLEQLKTMIIISCDQMTQVIMDEEGEMVFPQLETLILCGLPKLESFNSGNNVIHFPNLEKVAVSECPNMENFSRGAVITTRLCKIGAKLEIDNRFRFIKEKYDILEEVWEGDLKRSVRMIWEKHNVSKVKNYEDHATSSSSPFPSFE